MPLITHSIVRIRDLVSVDQFMYSKYYVNLLNFGKKLTSQVPPLPHQFYTLVSLFIILLMLFQIYFPHCNLAASLSFKY